MKVIIRPGELRFPLDPVVSFGKQNPLVIEAGFGDGHFLAHLAKSHPKWNLLGVEVSLGSIWRAYRRMLREEISNVRLYRGDARFIVRDVVAENSLSRIYITCAGCSSGDFYPDYSLSCFRIFYFLYPSMP